MQYFSLYLDMDYQCSESNIFVRKFFIIGFPHRVVWTQIATCQDGFQNHNYKVYSFQSQVVLSVSQSSDQPHTNANYGGKY